MSALAIRPGDRLHVLIWRTRRDDQHLPWLVSRALNGCPIDFASKFPTWDEAFQFAESEAAR